MPYTALESTSLDIMPIDKRLNDKYFFKKSLGQNILKDRNIINKIVNSLNIARDDVIVEIGPGLGALTDEIAKHDVKMVAIEKDTRFFDTLKKRYEGSNVQIINGDALDFDYQKLYSEYSHKLKIVGNLPYNISTQVLFSLFPAMECFTGFLFMFQKEVAERIVASPSTKDYGVLSVISQYYSDPKKVIFVPKQCFKPVPKVDSAVVRFDVYKTPPHTVSDEDLFKSVVKAAFAHRRKTLLNCFKGFKYKDSSDLDIINIFSKANIDLKRRGETLSLEEFSHLSECFYDIINKENKS